MKKYKVCVYAISKNEEQFVDRWMDAVNEADVVVVLDTGSTDQTVEKLKNRGAFVHEKKIDPWRFDVARNQSMAHIPDDIDICVCTDIDEVFEPGWRNHLEAAWNPTHTRGEYWFIGTHHADGTPDKKYRKEKIHSRHGYKWVRPVHEVLKYIGEDEENVTFINDIILHHYPDVTKPRSQYLPLLELAAEDDAEDAQMIFWLGREYMYHQQNDNCIHWLNQYLNLPHAAWEEERCAAMRYMATAYRRKNQDQEALRWLYKAIAECPYTREPWLDLAVFGYDLEDWPLSYWAVEKGLAIKHQTNSYLAEPTAWGHKLYDLGAIATYRLGHYRQAFLYAEEACKLSPTDKRLARNKALILEKQSEGS